MAQLVIGGLRIAHRDQPMATAAVVGDIVEALPVFLQVQHDIAAVCAAVAELQAQRRVTA